MKKIFDMPLVRSQGKSAKLWLCLLALALALTGGGKVSALVIVEKGNEFTVKGFDTRRYKIDTTGKDLLSGYVVGNGTVMKFFAYGKDLRVLEPTANSIGYVLSEGDGNWLGTRIPYNEYGFILGDNSSYLTTHNQDDTWQKAFLRNYPNDFRKGEFFTIVTFERGVSDKTNDDVLNTSFYNRLSPENLSKFASKLKDEGDLLGLNSWGVSEITGEYAFVPDSEVKGNDNKGFLDFLKDFWQDFKENFRDVFIMKESEAKKKIEGIVAIANGRKKQDQTSSFYREVEHVSNSTRFVTFGSNDGKGGAYMFLRGFVGENTKIMHTISRWITSTVMLYFGYRMRSKIFR